MLYGTRDHEVGNVDVKWGHVNVSGLVTTKLGHVSEVGARNYDVGASGCNIAVRDLAVGASLCEVGSREC